MAQGLPRRERAASFALRGERDGVAHDPFAPKLDHAPHARAPPRGAVERRGRHPGPAARGAGTEADRERRDAAHLRREQGRGDAVLALLDAGANVVAQDKVGATCLTLAAFRGHVAVARPVLDHPSTIASEGDGGVTLPPNANGETPLMAAAKAGRCR